MVEQQAAELNYDVLAERPAANWFERAGVVDHYANRDARRTTYREMVASNLRRSSTLLWWSGVQLERDPAGQLCGGQSRATPNRLWRFPANGRGKWARQMALTMRTAPQAWDAQAIHSRAHQRRRDMNYGLLRQAGYNPPIRT